MLGDAQSAAASDSPLNEPVEVSDYSFHKDYEAYLNNEKSVPV